MTQSPATLQALSTPTRQSEHRWQWEVPDTWQQGRGAFGGLVMAAIVRAMSADVTDDAHRLRTITATLCGPAMVGDATIEVEVLRQGSGTTTLAARLSQNGALRVHCVGLFGRHRVDDADYQDLDVPEMPPWREVERAQVMPPLAPVFAQHFEYRITDGFPYSDHGERHTCGWIRPCHPGDARDDAFLAAQMDAWWPALFPVLKQPRPMATVTFTMEFLGELDGLDPDAPLFLNERAAAASGGYATEFRELWGEDGRLLALNQQTFAIIK